MQTLELEGAVKGQRDMEDVHYGGEGPHWAVVPMKKKKKKYIIPKITYKKLINKNKQRVSFGNIKSKVTTFKGPNRINCKIVIKMKF